MSEESSGVGIQSMPASFGLAHRSHRAEFEIAVANILGASAYFNMIRNRAVETTYRYKQYSHRIPIKAIDLEKAETSSGFQKLDNALEQRGYKPRLSIDAPPSVYLSLNIGLR